jgi:hypothetical protein
MSFSYTKHVVKKIKFLKQLGINISKVMIEEAVSKPLDVDIETDKPRIIASAKLDIDHVLRVVYKVENDIIIVITCYPAKKGRYFKYEN